MPNSMYAVFRPAISRTFTQYVCFGLCLLIASLGTARAGFAEITAQAVRDSIRRGVDYLRDQQEGKGNWLPYRDQPGGATALCALALVNCGVPPEDPSIQRAMAYLRTVGNPRSTYATSLQTMVFAAVDPKRDRFLIRRNVEWLEQTQRDSGGWTYGATQSQRTDESNSQFAVLALNEAQRVGVLVQRETWQKARRYWVSRQKKDGAWGYASSPGSGSMTCAGIASLIICERHTSPGDAKVIQGNVQCCANRENNPQIQRGLRWLASNFSVARNPGSSLDHVGAWPLYYLYALERVGRMSGQRFIGTHDWYREGADVLVQRQDLLQGSWTGRIGRSDVSTAMALLFLSKGLRPVVVSKLKHSSNQQWNRHRHDVDNLIRYVERRWQRDLNWQYIDSKVAKVEDLLQSPVIFMSGKSDLRLSPEAKSALRDYVNQGGFLFAEACCDDGGFDTRFRQLMKELFPDSPLRPLPADHPVWYAEQRIDPAHMRPLLGLDSCCRTSVVYCPRNLGCYWELARGEGISYPIDNQREIDAVLGMGANVIAYATGRELRDKLDVPTATPEDEVADFTRGSLQIAKLHHNGGSDDAPAALTNLLRFTKRQLDFPVDVSRTLLSPTSPTLPDYPLIFMHGRRDFVFSEQQRQALRSYLENGGVLFADSICASKEFTNAFRREISAIFPNRELKQLATNHPIYSREFRGYRIQTVKLRRPSLRDPGEALKMNVEQAAPVLEALSIEDRLAVVFSPYDLSCALETSSSMECTGYTKEDAVRLGINIILLGLQQ